MNTIAGMIQNADELRKIGYVEAGHAETERAEEDRAEVGRTAVRASAEARAMPSDLRAFAELDALNHSLAVLADCAEPEDWSAADDRRHGYRGSERSGLYTYVRVTFCRAARQQRVLVASDGSVAALNTGLVSRFGLPVLMCFEPGEERPWRLRGFYEPGDAFGGVVISALRGELPVAPTYAPAPAWDGRPIYADFNHIVRHRAYRLPAHMLQANERAINALEQLEALPLRANLPERARLQQEVCAAVSADHAFADDCRRVLAHAIECSYARWESDPDTVATMYNAARGDAGILLPLWTDDTSAEATLAAVVSDMGGCLQVHTVISAERAAVCARITGTRRPLWTRAEADRSVVAATAAPVDLVAGSRDIPAHPVPETLLAGGLFARLRMLLAA